MNTPSLVVFFPRKKKQLNTEKSRKCACEPKIPVSRENSKKVNTKKYSEHEILRETPTEKPKLPPVKNQSCSSVKTKTCR